MRRLLLFAAALGLLGLSTAVAASFSVQAEDVATFSTDVSISVPDLEPTPFPNPLYVRSDKDDLVGDLLLKAPPKGSVQTMDLLRTTAAIDDEARPPVDPGKISYWFTWISEPAPVNGFVLSGKVTLNLEQNGLSSNQLMAGLFDCAGDAAADSADAEQCTLITSKLSDPATTTGQGYQERIVTFGQVEAEIDSTRQLRLKIINPAAASAADWTLSWGFLPSRASQLVVTP